MVSRRPQVWVRAAGWLGAPRPTRRHTAVPLSPEYAQSGRRPVTLRRAWQSCCSDCACHVSSGRGAVLSAKCRGHRGRAGLSGTTSECRRCRLQADAVDGLLVGRARAQTGSERCLPRPPGDMERLCIDIFIFTACCQVKVIFPLCNRLT